MNIKWKNSVERFHEAATGKNRTENKNQQCAACCGGITTSRQSLDTRFVFTLLM